MNLQFCSYTSAYTNTESLLPGNHRDQQLILSTLYLGNSVPQFAMLWTLWHCLVGTVLFLKTCLWLCSEFQPWRTFSMVPKKIHWRLTLPTSCNRRFSSDPSLVYYLYCNSVWDLFLLSSYVHITITFPLIVILLGVKKKYDKPFMMQHFQDWKREVVISRKIAISLC